MLRDMHDAADLLRCACQRAKKATAVAREGGAAVADMRKIRVSLFMRERLLCHARRRACYYSAGCAILPLHAAARQRRDIFLQALDAESSICCAYAPTEAMLTRVFSAMRCR